jgi:sugar lactone lactonase YvrE
MKRYLALFAVAALALTALLISRPLGAAENPPPVGTILTVAGTGQAGYSGDNVPATQAQLHWPNGVVFDAAGNLYIAEWYNDRVRKVRPDGTITTVAGTGQPGFSGDGGKATAAQLHAPVYLAVDSTGNLFIADFYNHRVRKVTPDGTITTYAGSGTVDDATVICCVNPTGGFSGDNGPATGARLNGPSGLALDALGNLFIADSFNYRVRKVSPQGGITTVAGNGSNIAGGDGALATEVGMFPWGLAVDVGGDLFISGGDRVRKVRPDGIITTVAGTGNTGFSGDGSAATGARLNTPRGIAVDTAGNLFVADFGNYRVRKVDAATGVISPVAGSGKKAYAGDGVLATDTGLRGPVGLAIDPLGNLLISDIDAGHEDDRLPDNERVMKVVGVAGPGLIAGTAFPR